MNEALNGQYGDKINNAGRLIMSARKQVYQNLKNTSSDESLKDILENKLDDYIESKHGKNYYSKSCLAITKQKKHKTSILQLIENNSKEASQSETDSTTPQIHVPFYPKKKDTFRGI